MITFYDFAGRIKGIPWNPNVWKIRHVQLTCSELDSELISFLNVGIAYKTVWLEYPDIEETMKKIGALPTTTKKRDPSCPLYTIPAIYDDSTGTAIADSVLIAEYLDKTYPSTPRLIPQGTHALQGAFRTAEYYERTRCADMGVPTLEVLRVPAEARDAEWDKVKDAFGYVHGLMKENDDWIMGDTISFADFIVASMIVNA
ncbi:hypothetical protein BT96DRAFT_1083826 [Gymnopus androsaceus JB14]|uniref:Uncharacterized protein n=1 Tax=Gymnopus androsaceus JB14 TaxID=1447944 RepID=A0A6A4I172_9AGAR|nr:hypothetical protein BT96DRAFT_1083826 [Gymnopus androsaceus JB14]